MKSFDYKIIRSNRKTIGIQINRKGEVLVRVPFFTSKRQINGFINSHSEWITNHLAALNRDSAAAECCGKLSQDEILNLTEQAKHYIPLRVAYFAPKVGVQYGRITIRKQKTRWGSCSSKGNLNFNCLLMLAPGEVIDSVVVHELCHIRHMNHSKDFYAEVFRVLPEYDKLNKWLKENGRKLMLRL